MILPGLHEEDSQSSACLPVTRRMVRQAGNSPGSLTFALNAQNRLWKASPPNLKHGRPIGPGSTVTTSGGSASTVAAGNPFPGATDPVIGTSNDCATGKVAAGNPNYTPVD